MKDREGTNIKQGDVVAMAITINQRRFSESFTIRVCQKNEKGKLILDGVWGWIYLKDCIPNEMQIITEKTDLRALCGEWIGEFGERGYDKVYMTTQDAHEFYEETCELIGNSVYNGSVEVRKEKAMNTLKAVMDKSIEEKGIEKIIKLTDIVDNISSLRKYLSSAFDILKGL